MLNNSPAVESVSPTEGSRHNYSFYICQQGHTNKHAHHEHRRYASSHYSNPLRNVMSKSGISSTRRNVGKVLTRAFGHPTEIRHLPWQANTQLIFTMTSTTANKWSTGFHHHTIIIGLNTDYQLEKHKLSFQFQLHHTGKGTDILTRTSTGRTTTTLQDTIT